MPVSTGRVSSREADRATREIVSTKACAGSSTRDSGEGSGQRGEVLRAQRPQVKRRRPADQLDVLLGGAQLHRQLLGGQRARHVEQQAGGQHRGAGPRDLGARGASRRPTSMSVASSSQEPSCAGDHHPGQGLHGAARRGDAGRRLQLRQQLGRGKGDLHAADWKEVVVSRGCGHVNLGLSAAVCAQRAVDWAVESRCGSLSGEAVGRARRGVIVRSHPRSVNSFSTASREPSSEARRAEVRRQAWSTVVWSRPPNSRPIAGSEAPVSSPREVHGELARPGDARRAGARGDELLGGKAEVLAGRLLDLGDRAAARRPARTWRAGRGSRAPRGRARSSAAGLSAS